MTTYLGEVVFVHTALVYVPDSSQTLHVQQVNLKDDPRSLEERYTN